MKIACLGWGSLIWRPENLKVDGDWHQDGPQLPIEFTRQSDNGRITLIVDPAANPVTVQWSLMTVDTIEDAMLSLQEREGTGERGIHHAFVTDTTEGAIKSVVIAWLKAMKLDAAIWTGLSYNRGVNNGVRLSLEYVIGYLKGITDVELRKIAEEYVRKAPKQIDTEYRRAIEQELGWK